MHHLRLSTDIPSQRNSSNDGCEQFKTAVTNRTVQNLGCSSGGSHCLATMMDTSEALDYRRFSAGEQQAFRLGPTDHIFNS